MFDIFLREKLNKIRKGLKKPPTTGIHGAVSTLKSGEKLSVYPFKEET